MSTFMKRNDELQQDQQTLLRRKAVIGKRAAELAQEAMALDAHIRGYSASLNELNSSIAVFSQKIFTANASLLLLNPSFIVFCFKLCINLSERSPLVGAPPAVPGHNRRVS